MLAIYPKMLMKELLSTLGGGLTASGDENGGRERRASWDSFKKMAVKKLKDKYEQARKDKRRSETSPPGICSLQRC